MRIGKNILRTGSRSLWGEYMPKCLNCGKEIIKKSHRKNGIRKYCDMNCLAQHKGYKNYDIAICMYCGKEFKESRERPNKFCSRYCTSKYNAEQRALNKMFLGNINPETEKKYNELTDKLNEVRKQIDEIEKIINAEIQCGYCGKWFYPTGSGHNKYCSDLCARKADNYRKEKRLSKNGKPDLSITLPKLYIRDNGTCQICGNKLSFEVDTNSNDYPSIDHIKPISKGGLHRWNNVQLLCRGCNTLKRDKY